MRMLWLMLHSSYYILYIHIRPSIPYIVGALSCIWGLLMRVFSGTGNAKYYRMHQLSTVTSKDAVKNNIFCREIIHA